MIQKEMNKVTSIVKAFWEATQFDKKADPELNSKLSDNISQVSLLIGPLQT